MVFYLKYDKPPQIRKQGRIHFQIIVYLSPPLWGEAADGGADSDCGFILDERNGGLLALNKREYRLKSYDLCLFRHPE